MVSSEIAPHPSCPGGPKKQTLCLKKSSGELKEIQATKHQHSRFFHIFQEQLIFWFNYFTVSLNLHIFPAEKNKKDFVSSRLPFMLAIAAQGRGTSAHCQESFTLPCPSTESLEPEISCSIPEWKVLLPSDSA